MGLFSFDLTTQVTNLYLEVVLDLDQFSLLTAQIKFKLKDVEYHGDIKRTLSES